MNVTAKASALFAVLDTLGKCPLCLGVCACLCDSSPPLLLNSREFVQSLSPLVRPMCDRANPYRATGAGKLPRIELWAGECIHGHTHELTMLSKLHCNYGHCIKFIPCDCLSVAVLTTSNPPGLLDYGYSSEEIALILDVAGPESPADRALDDLKEFAELSDEDVDVDSRLQEEERAYTPDFDDNAGTGEQEESNEQHLNSRDDGVKDRHRSKASLQIKIPHTLHEQSFESQVVLSWSTYCFLSLCEVDLSPLRPPPSSLGSH